MDKLYRVEFFIKKMRAGIQEGRHTKDVRASGRQEAINTVHRWCSCTYGCHAFNCNAKVVKEDAAE